MIITQEKKRETKRKTITWAEVMRNKIFAKKDRNTEKW